MVFVKGTDFLLEGGESSLAPRLLGGAAGPDRGGHRPPGRRTRRSPGRRGGVARPAGVTRLELARPRDISALLRRTRSASTAATSGPSWRCRRRSWCRCTWSWTASGMEELTARYDSSPSRGRDGHPHARELPGGRAAHQRDLHPRAPAGAPPASRRGRARRSSAGLDAFAPIFFAVLLAGIGIALGLVLLVLPGIYMAVRWYFVPQAVVIDGARGPRALEHSGELVRGASGGAPSASSSSPTWPR